MVKYRNLIEDTCLFNCLPKKTIEKHLRDAKILVKSYESNNIIHFENEKCDKLEIILKGKVVVERIDEAGNLLLVSSFSENDIIGGNLIFSKTPYYPLTVSTQSETVMLEVDKNTLFNLFLDHPDFLNVYLIFISDHASMLGSKIKNYMNKSIRSSIISFLLYESKKQSSDIVTLKTSKKSLAEKMGVSRTSLSRELAKMRNLGLIVYDVNTITILKDLSK